MSASYRLMQEEVLVAIGRTPPVSKYYGFTPYVYARTNDAGETIPVFASLGDTLNQLTVRTTENTAYGASMALVISADQRSMAKARAALEANGMPAAAINEMVLPADQIAFGLDDTSDATLLLGRIALAENSEDEAGYLADVPLDFYRLSPAVQGEKLVALDRKPRGDGRTEDVFLEALNELESAIVQGLDAEVETIDISSASLISTVVNPVFVSNSIRNVWGITRILPMQQDHYP